MVFLQHFQGNDNYQKGSIIVEPSPTKAVVKKMVGSLVCAFIFMKFSTVYPIKSIKDNDFMESTNFFTKFWFISMSTTVVRFKYYHAWLMADAICNNSGLGFNGYDEAGQEKWNLVTNINVISFEVSPSSSSSVFHFYYLCLHNSVCHQFP